MVGVVEFGVTVMATVLLDYVVGVLEQVEYQLAALAFLREIAGIEVTQDEWDARNYFLTQYSDIANEALLWTANHPYANEQVHKLWMETLATLT